MTSYTEDQARAIILGYNPIASVNEYYDAWQALYDLEAPLCEADELFMDKLICDGVVLTPENYDELGGVAVRGYSSRQAYLYAGDL